MKKLTLDKGKAIACLTLICVFLTNGHKWETRISIEEAKQDFEKNFLNLKSNSQDGKKVDL